MPLNHHFRRGARLHAAALALLAGAALPLSATAAPQFPPLPPSEAAVATVDLATAQGAESLKAQWRYQDARVVPASFPAPGPDGQPGTEPSATLDLEPRAGAADFDDQKWAVIAPESLSTRRTGGLLAFNWYRSRLTLPERVGSTAIKGMTLVLDTQADDYAEVWVNGELPRAQGQSGGSVVAGWNASNRLVIARDVRPGQQIQLAIFGANGPLSAPPTNYVYLKQARLEFHKADVQLPIALPPHEVNVSVIRKDPALDLILGRNPKLFKLAEGFQFTEGPVWVPDGVSGSLLFSDPNANRIYRLSSEGALSVFREPSGYEGANVAEYHQPGSNGLTLSPEGLLTFNQHGNRQVVQLDPHGKLKVLAARDGDKRLNSPNDLVFRSDGALYFTDPPFGLPKAFKDPGKELPYSGVYRVKDGVVKLLNQDFTGPNGLAFSPDEKFLYVGNWDDARKVVFRYPVLADGSLGSGMLFHDLTPTLGEDAIDGVKVDREGHVYVSGPGGLWVLAPDGRHLGTIVTPRHVHNFTFGDADGKTLYLCAREGVYRMRLNIEGIRPMPKKVQLPK